MGEQRSRFLLVYTVSPSGLVGVFGGELLRAFCDIMLELWNKA